MTASAPTPPAASPVGSVDKALVLLGILAEAGPEGMSLRDIAEESGLNKASVHRLLRALMHRGFAEQSASDQHYRLGSAALDLGPAFGAGENLQTLFGPVLASISQHTQELVHLGQMDGARVLYLDKVEPDRTVRVWSRIGSRAPAARTAMGRAMLAADGVRAEARTAYALATEADEPGTVISAAHLAEVVEQTAARGWSAEIEENEAGIACVGVALTREGGRSLAVSVTGPIERMEAARREEVGQLLREELSRLAPRGCAL
ncbi:MAG: IclR family transcriptional regulator, partial [Brachybacterium sp.]|nr:IclR family transcriptional regulator [Brachybacterium sp.]